MRFSVSVPVLSEQMAVAPPMVSHADSTRTKLLSFIIFFMEYASVSVTARGRPSGMDTTVMVMAYSRNCSGPLSLTLSLFHPLFTTSHLMNSARKHTTATVTPNLEILVAKSLSCSCSGVMSSPASLTSAMVRPHSLSGPTATSRMRPAPSFTVVPDLHQGSSSVFFLMGSLSPVRDASSTTRPWLSTHSPSATILSPVSSSTMSPTTSSVLGTTHCLPPRMTLMSIRSLSLFSFWNCSSLL
mmetsp:Transcript_18102/g.45570  ORF Transcript_18102/g.45570 Transcript_18102/m.45570 type:complete len:242 (-) Transcript_18102:610-1335(-)